MILTQENDQYPDHRDRYILSLKHPDNRNIAFGATTKQTPNLNKYTAKPNPAVSRLIVYLGGHPR